ncbi:MAG: beta-L-arabinofuranosidase domain-containing protein [Velocimicrobium sp.]
MRKILKKGISFILAATMLVGSLSLDGAHVAKAADAKSKIVYYDFQNYDSTIINDASGNGKAAVMRNYDAGGFQVVDANIYGKQVKALSLPGGADGGYLEFPEGILAGEESVTISMWVKLATSQGYQRIWDFGNGTTSYMYLLSDGENTGFTGYACAISNGGWSSEEGIQKGTSIDLNKWVLTTVVMDKTTMSLYENGTQIGTKQLTVGLSDLGSTVKNWIGYGQFGNDPTKGMFAEVSIYNYAMTENEVASLYTVDNDGIVDGDVADIDLGDTSAIISDITLPTSGANGSNITWKSNNLAIEIDGSIGKVVRPAAGLPDELVTLTATVEYGGITKEKDFSVKVLANYTDAAITEHDLNQIIFANLDAVSSNLVFPTQGEWGSTITWESSNVNVISETGVVTCPGTLEDNAEVTITANVKYGQSTIKKEFKVTVLAKRDSVVIVSYDPIIVTTNKGYAPFLPNFVKVTYSDNTTAKVRTIWPVSIDDTKYKDTGSFEVAGKLLGELMPIKATVTVVDGEISKPSIIADQFDLSDISLDGDSILTQNRTRTLNYLKLLDNNRMLYNFNKTFKHYKSIENDGSGEYMLLEDGTKVEPLGGWDEPTGLLRGHSTGHYLSALSLAYASTKDAEIKTKLDDMIHQLRELQKMSKGDPAAFVTKGTNQADWSTDPSVWGDGFISGYSPDQFALLEQYIPYATIWAPYYTLHKIMAGFIDAYEYTGNQEALEAAEALGKWVYNRLSACSAEQLSKMWSMYIAGELGGFNESMSRLYLITGDEEFLNGAKLFDNTKFFDHLNKNEDDIANRHANQHIPQIVGAMEEYAATVKQGNPEPYYYNIGKNFWSMVASRYAYSIGGVGTGENFKEPYEQGKYINGDRNCETCAAYNMLKLTKLLYQYDPDNAEYMDYYERTLYNQIIASQNPNVTAHMHHGVTYMLPIGPGETKSYGGDYDSFTCCHGTGMENHVKYQEAAYYKTDDSLYVNLYIPTTLEWKEKGLQVTQTNQFPSETTMITLSPMVGQVATPSAINMKFRIPYWATEGFTITVNGEVKVEKPEPSSYVELKDMKAGDVIIINMPYTYHLSKTPDKVGSSTIASIMDGPLVMVAKDSSKTMKTLILSQNLSDSIKANTSTALPELTINNMDFVPMFDAPNFSYSAYFKVITGEDDGLPWYEVKITNTTLKYGSFSLNQDMVKQGDKVVITALPNSDYKVKKLIVNGEEVTMGEDNTYTVANVTSNITIEGTFGLINPPVPDPTCLDQSALPSAHYTASWETIDGINNAAFEPTVSKGGTGKGWGNFSQEPGTKCWVAYTWETPVTMNTFQIFWYDDAGGTRVPSTIGFDYLDASGNWKEAKMLSDYNDIIAIDTYNTIKIENVTTTSIRINVTIAADAHATGIYRWKVSESKDPGPTPTPDQGTSPVIIPTQKPEQGEEPKQGEVPVSVDTIKAEISTKPISATEKNKLFYDEKGQRVRDAIVKTEAGDRYIVDKNGEKYVSTLVETESGRKYIVDEVGLVVTGKIIETNGERYYTTKSSGKLVTDRLFKLKGNKYYATKSGSIARGDIVVIDGNRYYTTRSTGKVVMNRLFKLDGDKYIAMKSGELALSKWVTIDGKKYYCNKDGIVTKTK